MKAMDIAMDIAKYIINKCTVDNCPISNLQLQKILYYIQVAFLKTFGYPCFKDPIEAWKFGPVVREVYYQYCGFGAFPIEWNYEISLEDSQHQQLIDEVVDEKKDIPPWDLVNDTHSPGKAWSRTYERNGPTAIISLDDMKRYG